ncbi:MAG: hypothetical protein UX85_C0001G0244 [Candidatus Beckwithbacteria bacterium GW2011_GWB1_47_15]|uniref:Major facilitator superfamily (MFS) profile domain-containing protein n=1 Tax=Candidatus Beckwithbacteria bacterium GW2011_GWB1_47_15 TaxID=1618371 RepID=A0A0G1UWE4_9BACT|nr:MAG: protein of unknown function with transmembrane region [Candidatus Beckwithbacteria bacterium GW2011_GWC1_49_16]AQS30882.1 hypothetical protein [uncultured bacterium]KKU36066.1 MAG: hypothetical protein UX50_C0001G0243 [Candidatus Beckwithbacteria bacterium GW2011_GWA1_46_30]KKU62030.1 MAG: hypothetical protein UX85_C0001G0244 [Candidatus Beckwithbacteria bacterium GW2011_GWB1_47_15]KKU72417.1 MAG: hypothetical protein UX97_C0001G0287 [Candidatus Beckwithbacteria bacterium GW2011_GWA2_47
MKLLERLKQSTSSPLRRSFLSLIIFNLSYLWFRSFTDSVLAPHFLNQGLSIQQIITGTVFLCSGGVLILFLLKKLSARVSWRWALIAAIIFILLIIKIKSPWQFYLVASISGLTNVLFWTAYNTAHFKLTPSHRTSFSSAIMFSLGPVIGLAAPLVAGALAEISYNIVWVLATLFFGLSFYLTKFQKNFTVYFSLKSGWRYIKAMRLLLLLEGIWEAIIFGIIPIFGLYFITTPFYYGTYLAYLALMSVLANLLLGRLSDKLQKRLIFIYPITVALALITFVFPAALNSLAYWLVVTGLVRFLMPLFWNFSTSIFVDLHPQGTRGFAIREFLLNFGRIIGLGLIAINFTFQSPPRMIFYLLGSVMLIYPAVIFYQTKISKKYSYL